MAIDFGDVRVGLALTDSQAILASPYKTLKSEEALEQISQIVSENGVSIIYLGLPLHLSGTHGITAIKARDFGSALSKTLAAEVSLRVIDERLSTKTATARGSEIGKKISKAEIDQLAAVEILEFALQIEKSSGQLAGQEIEH
ncbi:MAG: hypothetical protein RL733_392 [Actinomycetota bacterium]|jgi:putative Holliday junction resolvase